MLSAAAACAAPWVTEQGQARDDFPLMRESLAAPVVFSAEDFKVVDIAAHDFAADVERVTGRKPVVYSTTADLKTPAVLIGTLGHSALIDGLVAAGKLDVPDLRGAWESFVIRTVADPLPGVPQGLVIAGSDRRGTAFGVYELSQAIGVSPWYWWADVAPARKTALFVAAGTRRFGPPSVQYRGIFLNDEDWGLQPWAAKTFEPEVGDIGPKTYAKICELLLRLKANTLWPAMHACTRAFNLYPRNKLVADDYAVVMGSSHAEPMLRNNVSEWTAPHEQYDYVHNREGVRKYWEDRVRENGKFENIYTLGMRGIHDSNMIGPKTDAERIATLEQIFTDQREMLAKHARPAGRAIPNASSPAGGDARRSRDNPSDLSEVPQMFCAYKEVLALYRQGLKVPDDVTIVWPDDNFGYIRNFASPEELKRSGGFGVYYHVSYLGAPMSYLWLETTPPALIWEEMNKAYEHGAKKIWIVNVGDLKPAEIGTEFFLQMAWDVNHWRRDNLAEFLKAWAAREFGAVNANEIADILETYYRLNFVRKPEHLQWWLPGRPPHPSPLAAGEIKARLDTFARLRQRLRIMGPAIAPPRRDAFEELVNYPVSGAALANQRYFLGETGEPGAENADRELTALTRHFNLELAAGKWNHILALEPADDQWKGFRLSPWVQPAAAPAEKAAVSDAIVIPAGHFNRRTTGKTATWEIMPGLGQTGDAITVLPTNTPLAGAPPRLDYDIEFTTEGGFTLTIYLLPTHSLVPGRGLRFALGLDEARPQEIVCDIRDGSPDWAQGVLNNYVTVTTTLNIQGAGKHTLHLQAVDAGVVLDRFVLAPPVPTLRGAVAAAPGVTGRAIFADAFAGSSINVLANQSNTLLTHGRAQYAAFYSADAHLVLAKRALGAEQWEINRTDHTGNVADAHNTTAFAVDGEGFLHVAWDHHAQPLNYARGTAPGSLELGPTQPMTEQHERRVTYPMFFRLPDGGLLFLYRDGRSGQGNVVLDRYDLKTHSWSQVQSNLIDGEGARSAYLAATIDALGTLHLAWNWRETPDVATNHDLCYAKSADGGATWTTSTGAPLPLPINAANAEYAAHIPQGSSLMNPPSLTTDATGHPFIVSYWTPLPGHQRGQIPAGQQSGTASGSNLPQFHLVRHDGKAWSVTQVSSRTTPFTLQGGGTRHPPISRAAIVTRESPSKRPEFYLVYRDDERGGKITALFCRDLDKPQWQTRELTATSVGAGEPSIDPVQWATYGQIEMLVQNVSQQDGNDAQPVTTLPSPISELSWSPE